jgi:hypothetical protein
MINPNKVHRSFGKIQSIQLGMNSTLISVKLNNGHILQASLFKHEMPKYTLEIGLVVNFQAGYSIFSDGYYIKKIGSKRKV